MNYPSFRRACLAWVLGVAVLVSAAQAKTLRVFVVGNSFSNNATKYLPEIVKEGGHELIIAKAQAGGCSFARHWAATEAWLANPDDPKAKIYGDKKSLHEHMGDKTWDVITIQQYSLHSTDPATYQPFADKLVAHLKKSQPGAEIVIHQTWAYRADADKYGQVAEKKNSTSQREMWERSRANYWDLARHFGVRVMPVGDAFWRVDSDPSWGYKADKTFDAKKATHPALPDQKNSLHVGYRWSAEKKLGKDANHANAAGEYLGALVWYATLFGESPEKVKFVPPGVEPEFAAHLRKVAAATVRDVATENQKTVAAKKS